MQVLKYNLFPNNKKATHTENRAHGFHGNQFLKKGLFKLKSTMLCTKHKIKAPSPRAELAR